MGGSWEQMIGVTRHILDAMFLKLGTAKLTHEVLTTFMAEVTAIVNAKPFTSISTDPEHPVIVTLATLLTQMIGTIPVPPGQFDDNNLFGSVATSPVWPTLSGDGVARLFLRPVSEVVLLLPNDTDK